MMYIYLRRWGGILLALTILFFLIKRLHNLFAELEVEVVAFNPIWMFVSLILLFLYFSILGIPWIYLYRTATRTSSTANDHTTLFNQEHGFFLSSWTFFQLSQLGRYLPGKVGQFLWMFSLSHRFGIKNRSAVFATCFQLAFQWWIGCLIGLTVLRDAEVASSLYNLLADYQMFSKKTLLIGAIGSTTLGASIIFLYRRRIKEIFPDIIKRAPLLMSRIPSLISGYFLLWALLGIAFFFFIKSLHPVEPSQLIILTAIYAVAWSIGILSIMTPSGLGVREGILTLLLTTILPPATATLVALLSRLWTLGAEFSVTGIAFGIYRSKLTYRTPIKREFFMTETTDPTSSSSRLSL